MTDDMAALAMRVQRIEDELEVRRVILAYGPSADAGMAARAAEGWLDDGEYDWDAAGAPHAGRAGVAAMLEGEQHQGLIAKGAAHFTGPALVEVDGDDATALTYSMVMRRDPDTRRWYLWRVSAVRWELERVDGSWRIRRRTNRLLDETGGGRELFGEIMRESFAGEMA
jgi:hypothetical protein